MFTFHIVGLTGADIFIKLQKITDSHFVICCSHMWNIILELKTTAEDRKYMPRNPPCNVPELPIKHCFNEIFS